MRISTVTNNDNYFCNLEEGDCFFIVKTQTYFMKIEEIITYDEDGEEQNKYNAITLSSGTVYSFNDEALVTPVDMEARIIDDDE